MKKIFLFILTLGLIISLCACSGGSDDAIDSGSDSTDTTEPATTEEIKLPDRVITEIYGMFDERYDFIYEDVGIISGTFTANEETYNILDALDAEYSEAESIAKRPPAIYYLITKLGATRTDIMKYFAACYGAGITDIIPSDNVVDSLAGNNSDAVFAVCAHPSALVKNGRVYSLRMLLEGAADGATFTDAEIKETVERALDYYGEGLLESDRLSDAMKDKLISLGFIEEKSGGVICSVHSDDYHIIPTELEALAEPAAYEAYKNKPIAGGSECAVGTDILSFVTEFEIPMEKFIEIYDSVGGSLGNYNIELIYSGDAEAIDAYYRSENTEAEKDIAIDRAMAALKARISEDKGMGDFVTNVHEFSLAEILLMTDKDSEYLASLTEYTSLIPGLDLEGIYDDSATLMKMVGKRSVYYIDRYVTGRLTFDTPYEARSAFN